jgi:radical SAM superfamily enzyme YgiQ (UPF0313 family)
MYPIIPGRLFVLITYIGSVIRPPSEADSLILQATIGCSHNRCAFCGTYLDKKFTVKPFDKLAREIDWAAKHMPYARRVFLADGDAMVLSTKKLEQILDKLNAAFRDLQRVGIYANAQGILSKGLDELILLREKKLGIFYLGLESGSETILKKIEKGSTAAEMVDAVCRGQEAGMKASVIVLLGLGGDNVSREHAVESAKVVNRMNPRFLSFLSLMLIPGTPLHDEWEKGRFKLLSAEEMLAEMRLTVQDLELDGTIFRTNHASNYLPLAGRFPGDKQKILAAIDAGLTGNVPLRPEFFRAL